MKMSYYWVHLINKKQGLDVRNYNDCFDNKIEAREYGKKLLKESKDESDIYNHNFNDEYTSFKIVFEEELEECE